MLHWFDTGVLARLGSAVRLTTVVTASAALLACADNPQHTSGASLFSSSAQPSTADTVAILDTVIPRFEAVSDPPSITARPRTPNAIDRASLPQSLPPDSSAFAGQWRITTDWKIGKVDGDANYTFGVLTDVSLGPRGEILLLDFMNQTISVFAGNGTFVRRIGRPGHGPGEFNGPLSMAWDPSQRLWVADGWNFRYSVFDTAGRALREIRRPFRTATGLRQSMIIRPDGSIVDEFPITRNGRLFVAFALLDSTGTIRDTLQVLPQASSVDTTVSPQWLLRVGPALRSLRRFQPRLVYTLMPDGSVWFARSDVYTLHHQSSNGDTLMLIEGSHRTFSLTAAEKNAIEAAMVKTGLEPSTYQLGRQIVRAIRPLPDGHVLVQIDEEPGKPGGLFDVFDRAGRFRGSIRLDHPMDPSVRWATRGDTIIGVTKEDLDVLYVVRLTIRRGTR